MRLSAVAANLTSVPVKLAFWIVTLARVKEPMSPDTANDVSPAAGLTVIGPVGAAFTRCRNSAAPTVPMNSTTLPVGGGGGGGGGGVAVG